MRTKKTNRYPSFNYLIMPKLKLLTYFLDFFDFRINYLEGIILF